MLSGVKLCRELRSQTTFSCAHGPSLFSLRSCLAGLPAEAHAPMVIADKTKLSTTVCTAIFQLGHGVIFQIEDTIGTTVRRERSVAPRVLSLICFQLHPPCALADRHSVALGVT